MHSIREIKLHRAEGEIRELITRKVTSFEEADRILRGWAYSAPVDGSYHKCDVHIGWMDGTDYYIRYDLVSVFLHENPPLAEYVRKQLEYYGKHPEHLGSGMMYWRERLLGLRVPYSTIQQLLAEYSFA